MEKEMSLEEKAKKFARLWTEGKKLDVNPFKEYKLIEAVINYLDEKGYIVLLFPTNKYMAYYDLTDKGKEWALEN